MNHLSSSRRTLPSRTEITRQASFNFDKLILFPLGVKLKVFLKSSVIWTERELWISATLLDNSFICGISLYCVKCWLTSVIASSGFEISPYIRFSARTLSFSTPSTSICKWFNVVIADVRFFFAQSSCLMSLVMFFTISSVNSFCFKITEIKEKKKYLGYDDIF